MTQDDTLRMAREAGFVLASNATGEACAKQCDKTYYQHIGDGFGEVRYGIAACAAAIRARSTQ